MPWHRPTGAGKYLSSARWEGILIDASKCPQIYPFVIVAYKPFTQKSLFKRYSIHWWTVIHGHVSLGHRIVWAVSEGQIRVGSGHRRKGLHTLLHNSDQFSHASQHETPFWKRWWKHQELLSWDSKVMFGLALVPINTSTGTGPMKGKSFHHSVQQYLW